MSNALYAIPNGLNSYGTPGTPTYYQAAPATLPISANIVTGFASWNGSANPTGAFAGEEGNRLHFGLDIRGNGTTQFDLNDLTFSINSTDPSDTLAFSGDFVGYDYNGTSRIGINWGPDRIPGTADDIVYTSGNGMTPVDEIVYVGVGNAWDAYDASPGATLQDKIDRIADGVWRDTSDGSNANGPDYSLPTPFYATGTYSLDGATGSATVEFVPEPTGIVALLGLAGMGLIGLVWRRKSA